MKRLLLILSLFIVLHGRVPNDVETYALKIANCRRNCINLYTDSLQKSWCEGNCTLERACSTDSCALFCDMQDHICLSTCRSLEADLNCTATCSGTVSVAVSLSSNVTTPGYPHLNVSLLQYPKNTHTFVILLDDDSNTLDYTIEQNFTFRGLFPLPRYQIRVIIFSNKSCCTHNDRGKNYRPGFRFEELDAIEYYPFALPANWMIKDLTQLKMIVNSTMTIVPKYLLYNTPSVGPVQVKIVKNHTYGNESCFQFAMATGNFTYGMFKKSYVPSSNLGSGYLVDFDPSSAKGLDVALYRKNKTNGAHVKKDLNTKAIRFCKNFTNVNNYQYKLALQCAKDDDSMILTKRFKVETLDILRCFKSSSANGTILASCCVNGTTSCVFNRNSASSRMLNLALNSSYVLYFRNDLNNTDGGALCDGYYQRVTPANNEDIEPCCEPTELPPANDPEPPGITILVLSVLSGIFFVVVFGFLFIIVKKRFCTPELPVKPDIQPSQIGKELNRNDISKEKYIQRGGFGMIFEGRLKVKGTDDLSKFENVAIKILKPKLEDEELDEKENMKDAKKAMIAEINVMKRLQDDRFPHQNILKMFGYVIDASPYILVLELCLTDLKRYLKSLRLVIDNRVMTSADLEADTVLQEAGNAPSTLPGSKKLVSKTSSGFSRTQQPVDRGISTYEDSKLGRMTREQPKLDIYKDIVLTTLELLDYCWQVASGMDFIHSLHVIHRDIAADNILVTMIKEERTGRYRQVLKICDFGQSRILYDGLYTNSGDNVADRQRLVRPRWSAPEISKDVKNWSKFCDVWSFGVYMWEVYTLGGFPYSGWPDRNVFDNIISGMRMEKPAPCSEQIWNIMSRCWSADPHKRLDFQTIKDELDGIKTKLLDEEDKTRGIIRSDYVQVDCGPPEDMDMTAADDVDITAVDVEEGPLRLVEEILDDSSYEEKPHGYIIDNDLAVEFDDIELAPI